MTFNEYLNVEFHEMNSKAIEMRMPIKKEHMNELGTVHGAIIMALADMATGILAIDLKYTAPTQSSYTNFLRPIMETDYLYARSELIKRGRRTITIDCKLWGDDGKLAAINRSDFVVLDENVKLNPSDFIKKLQEGNYKKY